MTYTKENIYEGILAKIGSINVSDGVKRLLLNQIPQYPIEIEFKETKFTIPNKIWRMVVRPGYDN
jgi:hypothetical protein